MDPPKVEIVGGKFTEEYQPRPYGFLVRKDRGDLMDGLNSA